MDPITVTTTLITLATFIKDLIEVGQSIKRSIEQVGENRRRVRELANDVLRSLTDLASLTRGHKNTYQVPALLGALGDLRADMLHVLEICRRISPVERRPGLKGFRSQVKVWMKRDEVEKEIRRLKEHVNRCYLKFTAFSAARNEQTTAQIDAKASHIQGLSLANVNTTLRVEQTAVVNHIENQLRLQRLEGMMARILLEEPFGQDYLNRTIDMISADPMHESLESQYLSVQTMRLINSLQGLMTGGKIAFNAALWDPTRPLRPVLMESPSCLGIPLSTTAEPSPTPPPPPSPTHILHWILGIVVEIYHAPNGIRSDSIADVLLNLAVNLMRLGRTSEAIVWQVTTTQILSHLSGGDSSGQVLPWLAASLHILSRLHQHQLRYELALESSEQALNVWRSLSSLEAISGNDTRPLFTALSVTHSHNLRMTGQHEIALTIAREAVTVSRPMMEEIIHSGSEIFPFLVNQAEYNVIATSGAFFTLGAALASVERHIEAYEVSTQGLRAIVDFSRAQRPPPAGAFIDPYLDRICELAETNGLSLPMLADSVVLFRDLALIYPEDFNWVFLRLLYAYAYFSEQTLADATALNRLPAFLELDLYSFPPLLATSSTYLDDFDPYGGVLDAVLRSCFVKPWENRDIRLPLVKNLFVKDFDKASTILRELSSRTDNPESDFLLMWAIRDFLDVLPAVPYPNQLLLLEITGETITYLRTSLFSPSQTWAAARPMFATVWAHSCWSYWVAGILDGALSAAEEAERLQPAPGTRIDIAFVLYEMGRVPEAIEVMRKVDVTTLVSSWQEDAPNYYLCFFFLLRVRLLRRTGRNLEALGFFRMVKSLRGRRQRAVLDLPLQMALVDLPAILHPEEVLCDARRVSTECRRQATDSPFNETSKWSLAQSLMAISNGLTAFEKIDEALVVAEEATSIYTENAPRMWREPVYAMRKEELGANAHHSLSLVLATSGRLGDALFHAEEATGLYRGLVSLAPRHLSTLASSLRNLASILWKMGRHDESIAACKEAVEILQKISDRETHLLATLAESLDQLAEHVLETEDVDHASAATAEAADVRAKIALLPPQPDFLFSQTELAALAILVEEDESDTESDGVYHDVSEAVTNSEVVATADIHAPSIAHADPSSEPQSLEEKILGVETQAQTRRGNLSDDGAAVKNGTSRFADILAAQLEIRVKLSSTPMDILWSVLFLVLGGVVAIFWSRVY